MTPRAYDRDSDAELCRAARRGRAATAALVARYTPMVHNILNSLRLPAYVEFDDLVQVGLVAIARVADSGKWDEDRRSAETGEPVKFFTYLFTAVRNDLVRESGKLVAQGRRFSTCRPDAEDDPDASDPFDAVAAPAERPPPDADFAAKMAALPPAVRTVVEMHYGFHTLPAGWGEIAAATGLSVPQAKRALEVAKARLA